MDLNCKICESSLKINETGLAVYCPECDRTPDRRKESLGGLLDAIKEEEPYLKFLRRTKQIFDTINEATGVTIQYKCLKCEKPTNQYGYCLWCRDELNETL